MSVTLIEKDRTPRLPGFSVNVVLECARGIAALWVFMFHIAPMFAPWPMLATIARYGHQGVPLFFVLSGYCMMAAAENTLQARRGPANFLKRRLLRIFPPFWLSVLAVMAAPYAIEAISALKTGAFSIAPPAWMAYTWIDWIEVLTLTKVFDNTGGDLQAGFSQINVVYWSLAIEVQFYLIMTVSLVFTARWKKILVWVTLLSVLACLSPSLANSGLFMKYWPAFFVGLVLREIHQRGGTPLALFGARQLSASLFATVVLLALLFGVIFAPACATPFACSTVPNLTFTLAALLSALLLWTFGGIEHALRFPAGGKSVPFLKAWMVLPLAWVGQSSYSLYLLHGKIHQLPMLFVRQVVAPTSLLFPLLTMGATVAMCYGFYLLAEKPFHMLAQRSGKTPVRPLPAPVLAASAKQ
jgi:peptidoglycan/LPS O-acetylase OafA/YrhL